MSATSPVNTPIFPFENNLALSQRKFNTSTLFFLNEIPDLRSLLLAHKAS
ncbi:hypothetical protein FOWG_04425 [Fusarium oxysporum f. sp. lycopersici MN25]|uniref:Uncharacterized protein n=1 Tax=Fusarium oxysporum Fo47 TaxID=660027 RepID=W9JHE1_FUSOX|nr:hypothetical protein FOZG_14605 [Fusarium oxysporum Fo47]EWZ94043.1 hypothetical protein FOWG_04425 [Fusarium oxysporum f. sp. lycopersici MN25]